MKFRSHNTVFYYALVACIVAALTSAALINFLSNRHALAETYGIFAFIFCGGVFLGRTMQRWHMLEEKPADALETHGIQKLPEIDSELWQGFDVDDPRYPEELDIAFQTWLSVRRTVDGAPIRGQLSRWLKNKYPDLPQAAVDRIVGVCNWDKSGGRPKINQ